MKQPSKHSVQPSAEKQQPAAGTQKIDPKRFFEALKANGAGFFTGVPDSLLKDICAYITGHTTPEEHLIAANEGGAVGLATGYHLATGKLPVVYMQNSGIGNAVNPLLSLADPQVYSIPMILLIGWRGEPCVKDEPQHIKQGRVQNALLDAMEIPYSILDTTVSNVEAFTKAVAKQAWERKGPVAIVVREKTFQACKLDAPAMPYGKQREAAIGLILDSLPDNALIVSTTGKTSREVFEYREQRKQDHSRDFLTVGSMGHCSQIALALALNTDSPVVCLDGDGAAIMHLGAMSLIGANGPANLCHIVLNNGAHESVGGQPTVGYTIDFVQIAQACGYKQAQLIATEQDFEDDLAPLLLAPGPVFLDIRVNQGSRDDLGRPTSTPLQNKEALMKLIGSKVCPNVGTNLEDLKGLLDDLNAKRVFLVTGKHAYEAAPPKAASIAARMEAVLMGREYYRHWDFGVNPQLDDLMRGAEAFRSFQPDVLVAIGGGSVMDTAKLLPLLPAERASAEAILKGETTNLQRSIPFIAIPTTAGSGSEATQFSVVYIGIEKCTVDNPIVLPDSVILDPSLTYHLPAYLTATTGMDALSQAFESYWSKGATAESQTYAAQAIQLILSAFPDVVNNPTEANRTLMLEGSYLAGKAINISRTTAPHAVSYRLAQVYKIPHGHAVAMTLPTFFEYNLEATEANAAKTAKELCNLLGCSTIQEGKAKLEHLMDEAGLKRRFTALGATNRADLDDLVASVNQQRLSNNPRPVDAGTLHRLLEALW